MFSPKIVYLAPICGNFIGQVDDEPVDGADKAMGSPQKQPAMGVEKHCIQCGYNQNVDK